VQDVERLNDVFRRAFFARMRNHRQAARTNLGEDLKMLAAMSIRGSWLHEVAKARHLAVIDQL